MNRWKDLLEAEERIVWQGRPAPRAYTFRNWRWSLQAAAGLVMVLFFRQGNGPLKVDYAVDQWWTWAGLVVGLWAGIGHLIWARLEWERVFYLLTDRRLLVVSGILGRRRQVFPLEQLQQIEQDALGPALATVKISGGGQRLTLYCLEYPHLLLQLLSSHVEADTQKVVGLSEPAQDI
ncbi:MAG: hypothetical protein BA871_10640 [Desulfuromonadales bacterium C00003096]|jgi:membrane protein YdbS with pleckstrin-like domain|nr:MAG: hypothetical protein BA871_10640 [Desulfuromonadales bacterium C00003096]